MQIRVFSAAGTGPTPLAAFDRALQAGGTHDTNLIVLSSVIPQGADVVRETAAPGEFKVGDRLFCVMAEQRASEPGAEAWAGLAWATDDAGAGGLFVEAHGHSEHQVRWDLEQTLDAIVSDRPYWTVGDQDLEVVGATCDGHPVCSLVMAIYESVPWTT